MTYTQLSDSSFWSALQQRKDLEKYGNLNCALYAIELHNNIDSIELIDWPPESPDNQYHLNK
ncbi:hypothetical protein [Escherichia coli]|uniref:hypothetical protein n=1 Tax=Escherichia coli TaxID=562 RepID=UPI001FF59354|nr:hypothetical protein [Escherichia coli]